jgi:hypothetical protein
MKFIVKRINCVYANLKANDPSLTVDCDIHDFDRLLGEISEEIGDDVFMEWVRKNIPNQQSEANELLLENGHMAKAICNYQERIKVLDDAIKLHRQNVWGYGPVEHAEDVELYSVIE